MTTVYMIATPDTAKITSSETTAESSMENAKSAYMYCTMKCIMSVYNKCKLCIMGVNYPSL